jgi:hypothetical protein
MRGRVRSRGNEPFVVMAALSGGVGDITNVRKAVGCFVQDGFCDRDRRHGQQPTGVEHFMPGRRAREPARRCSLSGLVRGVQRNGAKWPSVIPRRPLPMLPARSSLRPVTPGGDDVKSDHRVSIARTPRSRISGGARWATTPLEGQVPTIRDETSATNAALAPQLPSADAMPFQPTL